MKQIKKNKQTLKQQLLSVLDDLSILGEEDKDALQTMQQFRSRLSDDEFCIAVVGEFSSGKSTFINAMLKQDILKHGSTETTAVSTKIVNVSPDDERCGTGKVELHNGEQIVLKSFSELAEYTTTSSKQYSVVEQISRVILYCPIVSAKRKLAIVDTPGLNGIADGHREQTIDLVRHAHACIYVMQRRGLAESDINFLRYLVQFQKEFIFVQNFIDNLNAREGESVEAKLAGQKKILDEQIFREQPNAHYSICGVSALQELSASDHGIQCLYADSSISLTEEMRAELHEKSRFDSFRHILETNFADERLDRIQYGYTGQTMLEWLRHFVQRISVRQQQTSEVYEYSMDKRKMDQLDHIEDQLRENVGKQQEYLDKYIDRKTDEIRQQMQEKILADTKQLQQKLNAALDACKQIETLRRYQQELPNDLMQRLSDLQEKQETYCISGFRQLYEMILLRIQEYTGFKNTTLNLENIEFTILERQKEWFQQTENEISWLKRMIHEEEEREQELLHQRAELADSIQQTERNKRLDEQTRSNRQQMFECKKKKLEAQGRPKPTPIYSIKEHRKFILFGKKEEIRTKIGEDDFEGIAYDNCLLKLKNDYNEEQSRLTQQINAATRKLKRLQENQEQADSALQQTITRIKNLESQLETSKRKQQKEQELATAEYLRFSIKQLKEDVANYLFGDEDETQACFIVNVKQQMEQMIQTNQKHITAAAQYAYEQAVQKKLEWIQQAKQQECPELLQQVQKLTEIQRLLNTQIKRMEELLK